MIRACIRPSPEPKEKFSRAREIAAALGGDWNGRYGLVPGPGHSSRDRSVKIVDAPDQPDGIIVHSFSGDSWEAVKSWLRSLGLLPDRVHRNPINRPTSPHEIQSKSNDLRVWSSHAQALWERTETLSKKAKNYFESRRVGIPRVSEVRFVEDLEHWLSGTTWPAIVARVSDFVTGRPITLHFTFLASDGSSKAPIEQPKLLLPRHPKKGGVVRLSDDSEVASGLGLAEGIETSLAIDRAGWRPIWAAIDSGNLAALPVVDGIESLTIFADHDRVNPKTGKRPGLNSACQLARRWRNAGREVRIIPPLKEGEDWADVLGRS